MNSFHRDIWIFSILVLSGGCMESEEKMGELISVSEFEKILHDKTVQIIDVRDEKKFRKAHISGAINLPWKNFIDEEKRIYGFISTEIQFEKLMSKTGVLPEFDLIFYDDKGAVEAARLWWVFKNFGFKNAKILEGGLLPWKEMGYPVDSGTLPIEIRDNRNFSKIDFSQADMGMVERKLGDSNTIILDVRTWKEYSGEVVKNGAEKGGRIPGSILINYRENYRFDGQGHPIGFKDIPELSELYRLKGVTPDKEIIVYCHTAVRSSLTTFVLTQLLNYKKVYNYDGSWREWSHKPDSLIEKG
jgi:thiosulfate/3-mercaptopyruvate sulfurtransferase